MTISVEKIVESFPDTIISPIFGAPTYESIAELFNKFNGNAESIQMKLGGGSSATWH